MSEYSNAVGLAIHIVMIIITSIYLKCCDCN